jgi:hypothetical protein
MACMACRPRIGVSPRDWRQGAGRNANSLCLLPKSGLISDYLDVETARLAGQSGPPIHAAGGDDRDWWKTREDGL